jgi:hypothetical protein
MGFEPVIVHFEYVHAPTAGRFKVRAVGVAQLVELLVVVQAVGGSSPLAHLS